MAGSGLNFASCIANWLPSLIRPQLSISAGSHDICVSDLSGALLAEAGIVDWIMHIIALPWTLLAAALPPVKFAHGWALFYCALLGRVVHCHEDHV